MQSIPLAVLKLLVIHPKDSIEVKMKLHAIHTACGIETVSTNHDKNYRNVLHAIHTACGIETSRLLNQIRAAVLLHAIHTACGIETTSRHIQKQREYSLHAIHTACGIETCGHPYQVPEHLPYCMQSIPLAVLKLYEILPIRP